MEKNEIKKLLYKQNPMASISFIRKGIVHYQTLVDGATIYFEVPVIDMGDADFYPEMDAKLLIRYLMFPETAW